MSAERFDVAILGGGPGGYVAAIRAGQLGLRTAVIEKDKVGGTCLHWGCIPTKALLETAEVIHMTRRAGEFGLRVAESTLDLRSAMERKERVVKKLFMGTESLLRKSTRPRPRRPTCSAGTPARFRGPRRAPGR